MAVTREQIAQWSKNFEAKNPGTSTAQSTTKKKESVSREQISQWSQNFEQQEKQKKQQAANDIQSKALQQYTERHASDIGEVDARNEPSQSLLRNASSPKGGALGRPGNSALDAGSPTGRKMAGLATEASSAFDMSRKWGTVAQPNVLEDVGGGATAYGTGKAQALKASYAPYSTPDEFDRINQWLDTGDNKNLAEAVRRVDNTNGAYTDKGLIKAGWTQEQIKTARQMNAAMDAIPGWKQATRRVSNTAGGIADTIAAAPLLGAEYGVQSAKNIAATQKNWEKVRQEIKDDEHAQSLYDLLTDVDMDYNPTWPESRNRELISMGYNSKEIREMRDRLAGLEVNDGIDKNQSVGYQLYDRGQQLLGAAQSGLSPAEKAVSGAVTSAAENLTIASMSPYAVLPMLSAQGAAEAMGQSAAKGESAGKALSGGIAKFGAGWAINSVGAADLAKTMGSDYAKDTLAGQIADWVQGMAGSSAFAKAHPAVASAISGGMDNAMQAFVETYADKAIDAALGDSEAAENLFSKDTFLSALESGLSGGASGAMGGAVGSGLRGMSEAIDRASETKTEAPAADAAEAPVEMPEKEIAKALQPSMDATSDPRDTFKTLSAATSAIPMAEGLRSPVNAASDPRDTSETFSAHSSAETSIVNISPTKIETLDANAPEVSGSSRGTIDTSAEMADRGHPETPLSSGTETTTNESAGSESDGNPMASIADEGGSVKAYEDEVLTADEGTLDTSGWASPEQKAAAAKLARAGQVSTQGVQTMVDNMPGGIGAQVYTQAAKAVYRAGVYNVESFEKALNATGPEGTMGGAVRQVMALGRQGETALKLAYLQGKGEAEAYSARKAGEIGSGKGFVRADAGTVYNGEKTLNKGTDPDSALLDLTAKSTGTVVHRMMEGLANNAKGCIRAAAGEMYFAGDAGSETVMHETFHALNEWSSETGQAVMDKLLESLVERNGAESTEKLLQSYLDKYAEAGVRLTYNQALEEVTADAMETVFGTEESFRDFVRQQAAEARMNADAKGTIDKVMGKIQNFLESVLKDVKRFLKAEPTNAAAKAAKNLTEQQLADLRALYFEHQTTAGEKLREAMAAEKENKNAAPSGKEDTAVKYSIRTDENGESYVKIDEDILEGVPQEKWKSAIKQAIRERFPNGFERNGWTILNHKDGRNEFVWSKSTKALQWENAEAYADKMRMAANLDEIIQMADEVYREPANHKNAEAFNRGKIKIMVGQNAYEADVLTAIKADDREIFYDIVGIKPTKIKVSGGTHVESKDSRSRLPETFIENTSTQLPKAVRSHMNVTQEIFSDNTIAQTTSESKADTKYQLEVDSDAADETRESGRIKYSIDVGFEKAIDELDENATWSKRLRVGATSEVLKSIGVKDQNIYWDSGKIRKILTKHSAENFRAGIDDSVMTKEIIKQVPKVLENPVIVLHSDTSRNADYASRIYMFGEVYDQTGKPVDVSLELLPTNSKGLEVDSIVVTSAYGKRNVQGLLNRDQILYIDPNKNRTDTWLAVNRLHLPLRITRYGSIVSLRYSEGNVKADTKYQLEVDSDAADETRESGLGDVEKQTETIRQAVEAGGNARVSEESLADIARAVRADHGSRVSTKWLTERLGALSDYLSESKAVDWADANAFVMDMAEQIMQKSSKKNDELWKAYPELHQMSLQIQKGSSDQQELVYRYGSMANARREAARHGVKLTYTKDGAASRWDGDYGELKKLGAGLFPNETPASAAEALEAQMSAHDAIKPTLENAYDEDWDGAKQDIAMQIWQRYMNAPEMAVAGNAELREQFSEQRKEMRDIARQQALEARAKVQLEQAKRAAQERKVLTEPYQKETDRAKDRAARAEAFAKKQRESVAARVQQEKDKRLAQAEKARDAREMDNTRRSIRKLTGELTQMTERPSDKSYVPEYLLDKVRPVVMLANDAIGNHEAAKRLTAGVNGVYGPVQEDMTIRDAMSGLQSGITREMRQGDRAALEWQNSGLPDAIDDWLADVNENRQMEMEKLRAQMKEADEWLPEETPEKKAWVARLNADLKAYQDGGMATLTVDELRGLREILEQTMFIVKNEGKILGSIEEARVDEFAEGVSGELKNVADRQKKGLLMQAGRNVLNVYRLNAANIERNFERLGGYEHGGFMEQMGQMLNEGQSRKNRILAEGEKIFADLTGPEHEKELWHFTHDLVDIGLVTEDGKPWMVTHDVMTELWVQLQNRQGMHHLLHGGATIADMSLTTKGLKGLGQQNAETVKLGQLATVDEAGNKLDAYEVSQREDELRTSIIGEIEKNLTEYDDKMIKAFRELGKMTKGYINETSMELSGVKKARVDNYIRLHVDRNTNVEQNTGIQYDNSVGNQGFLKNRVNSSKPLELVGLLRQASENIENTAQYAGMAIPLRNAEKVLNTMRDGKTLYGQLEKVWGEAGRDYMNKALADLCGTESKHEVFDRLCSTLRGNAAAAVLSGNLNVTLLQAASLPTAAAELGWGGCGKSVLQFVKNISPSKLAEIEKLAYEHGDMLLPTRLRGSGRGELMSTAKGKGVAGTLHDAARNNGNLAVRAGVKALDAVGDFAAGSIGKVDEITVAALYHGAMEYVKSNPAEFGAGAEVYDSPEYWDAVNQKYRRVVERTQPNYTTMQRTGFQRTENQMAKTLMMFSTQRQQNAQIIVNAAEDLAAQSARYRTEKSAANKKALDTAKKRMWDAATSQIVQTAVIAGLSVGVKFLFHRWDELQDENGDMTWGSILSSFAYQFFNSGVSNYVGAGEAWTAAETVLTGKSFGSYDTISMTGFSAVNDVIKSMAELNGLLDKDTSEMTEEEFAAYEDNVRWAWADAAGQLTMLNGMPYNNAKKYIKAVFAWMDTMKEWDETGEKNFNSLPASATGQYDRLYNAVQDGDKEEVAAAMGKLEKMGKTDKVNSELARRLKAYDEDILTAAKAKNAGDERADENARRAVLDRLCEALGVARRGNQDKARRTQLISLVNKAANDKADELLKAKKGLDKDASVYESLTDELENGRTKDVQAEIDRLLKAGKEKGQIKTAITNTVKSEYLAGSEGDREKLEKKLLDLKDADGEPLYEEKNFTKWVSDAEKEAEEKKGKKDWWD